MAKKTYCKYDTSKLQKFIPNLIGIPQFESKRPPDREWTSEEHSTYMITCVGAHATSCCKADTIPMLLDYKWRATHSLLHGYMGTPSSRDTNLDEGLASFFITQSTGYSAPSLQLLQ